MPAQKNQHFVPRAALKPFTLNSEGAAINVFNIKRNLAIQNAPVKGQCARDYFYGKDDLKLENCLVQLEGEYARIVRSLVAGGTPDDADHEWLSLFSLVQFRRTARAIEEMRECTELMVNAFFGNHPEKQPQAFTDTEMVIMSLRSGFRSREYRSDLTPVIFENQTGVRFVISDNPLVLTNRFFFQRLNAGNFGLANSGAILAMPVSQQICIRLCGTISQNGATASTLRSKLKSLPPRAQLLNPVHPLSSVTTREGARTIDAERQTRKRPPKRFS